MSDALSLHTLTCGLRVVILEDPAWPVVAVNMWVHAGGKDETDRVSGYSHYLEHLTSRGTLKRAPLQDRLEIFHVGGLNSANTYHDRTTYYNVVKKEHFDLALDVLADVMQNARLPDEGIENERKVVTEELRRYYDNPDSAAYRELFALAFAPHPYARPVIGTFETLDALRHDDFYSYYKQMYTPGNMVLAICGDVRSADILPKIEAAFAGFAPGPGRLPHAPLPKAFKGYQDATLRLDLRRSYVNLAFVVPGWRHPDRWALEALGRVLGGGASSRLWQRTVEDLKVAIDAGADNHTLEDLGLFYLLASPVDPRDACKLEAALLAEIGKIRDEGIDPEELERVKRQARLHEIFSREEVLGRAQGLGESLLYGGIRYHAEHVELISAVTPEAVRDVARRYLVAQNLTVVRTLPQDTPEPEAQEREAVRRQVDRLDGGTLAPAWLDFGATLWTPDEANQIPRSPSSAAPLSGPPEMTRRVLPNGLTVLFRPKRGKGVIAIALHARAGAGLVPRGLEGLAQLASSLPFDGTLETPQEELARRFDRWGGYYSLGVDRDLLYGRVVLSVEDALEGAALFGEVVMHPRFDPLDVAKEKARQSAMLERQADSIVDVAWNAFYEAAFHSHPYANPILGTPEGLEACTADNVAGFWRSRVIPSRSVLTVVGDLSEARFERLLEATGFAQWAGPKGQEPHLTCADPGASLAGRIARPLNKQQVQVILGAPAIPLSHPDYLAVRTLATLVGFRCFVDLVYNKPLAYSTGGTAALMRHGGALALFIGSAADNAELAVRELENKWRQALEEPTERDELAHIKDRIIGGQALADQRAAALAASYGYYEAAGLGFDFYDRQAERIRALSAADLQTVAQRYLQPERMITALVGPGVGRLAPAPR